MHKFDGLPVMPPWPRRAARARGRMHGFDVSKALDDFHYELDVLGTPEGLELFAWLFCETQTLDAFLHEMTMLAAAKLTWSGRRPKNRRRDGRRHVRRKPAEAHPRNLFLQRRGDRGSGRDPGRRQAPVARQGDVAGMARRAAVPQTQPGATSVAREGGNVKNWIFCRERWPPLFFSQARGPGVACTFHLSATSIHD